MKQLKRLYVGSIATETNTFSPLRTDLRDFKESFYAEPGEHPDTPTLCSAVFNVARAQSTQYDWDLQEGTATWAEPGGIVNQNTWEHLRDQMLGEIESALPLDGIVLGLHGAMVSQACLDCEGELLAAIRQKVGADVIIGATLDPHSHLSDKRVSNADILVAFKEFPHTDFVIAAEKLIDLVQLALQKQINPVMSVFDCKMIDVLPTSREPMRGFVDRMLALEDKCSALSISTIHGFMAGDVPDLGTKVLVITDDQPVAGEQLARQLGMELFSYRGSTLPEFLTPAAAIAKAQSTSTGPIIVADVWDNPGGGVAGDSTIILNELIAQRVTQVGLATIWDPIAVRTCFSAGCGAVLRLRLGGKMSDTAGPPVDAEVTVHRVVRDAEQRFGDSIVPLGDCAWVELHGIHVILNSIRSQVFSPDVFTQMGIDPLSLHLLVVKSTNHFYAEFSRIALFNILTGQPASKLTDETARYRNASSYYQ